jgi:hypothetical protein
MTKKPTSTTPTIIREDHEWGVRLLLRPFPDPQYSMMEISTEITLPRAGRGAEMRTRFTGVPVSNPLRATDVIAWVAQLNAIQTEARKIATEMKAPKKATPKKKAKS